MVRPTRATVEPVPAQWIPVFIRPLAEPARIIGIPKGIGQGQFAASGTLARTSALGGATTFPAVISIPDEMSRESLRLAMSGSATAFAGNAGVIGLLASILVWISSYTAYL